jgi:hypothetical protein
MNLEFKGMRALFIFSAVLVAGCESDTSTQAPPITATLQDQCLKGDQAACYELNRLKVELDH